jgi:hypothetical protein
MSTYLEMIFRTKFRLLALVLVLPVAFAAVDLYLWRSYTAAEMVWVGDPSTYGQGTGSALSFDPFSTPAQNFARLFSNLFGSQSFNNALIDKMTADGVVQSDRDRATLAASLSQLAVMPGRGAVSSAGASGGGGGQSSSGDHIITLRYVCTKRPMCQAVLTAALDIFRSTYIDLRAKASADAKGIYQAQLTSAEADVARITKQIQAYIASLPKTTSRNQTPQQVSDPVYTGLQHQLESAQKAVDAANAQIVSIDTVTQSVTALFADMTVVDGPRLQDGLYGISGLGNDNIKLDAIAFAACFVAAVFYVMLVVFLDRAVRDPSQLKRRLRTNVIAIPDYQHGGRRRRAGATAE